MACADDERSAAAAAAARAAAAAPARPVLTRAGLGRVRRRRLRRCSCWSRRCNLLLPAGHPLHLSDYFVTLDRQDHVLRDRRAGDGPDLGLRRHPVARPRPLLRARRLRDGHVPDALDRPRGRLPQRPARLHGVPRLEGLSLVLELHRPLLVRARCSSCWCRACSRSCSATSRSARASRASTSRSSRRR